MRKSKPQTSNVPKSNQSTPRYKILAEVSKQLVSDNMDNLKSKERATEASKIFRKLSVKPVR